MKATALCLIALILFNSCYTYKQVHPMDNKFAVGEKYEIRIGNHKKHRVRIKEVSDSTLLVLDGKSEMVVQRTMISESRRMDFSTEKTVLASIVGAAALLGAAALIAFKDGIVDGDFLNGQQVH